MHLNVFVPLADGQSIPLRSFASLSAQTIPTNIIPCVSEGIIKSNGVVIDRKDKYKKTICEVVSRNKIPELITTLGIVDNYILMQDRDAEHMYADNLEKAIVFLDSNKDYAAVALPSTRSFDRKKHFIITCVLFRTEFMKTFKFRALPELHTCDSTYKDIISTGKKYGYLVQDKILVNELKD